MERLTPHEVDELLSLLTPHTAKHADSILDLRELLLQGGHPGKCVRCFFTLSQSLAGTPNDGVARLRRWLERNIELSVTANGKCLETIPFRSHPGTDLETFCRNAIRNIRLDRAYRQRAITIRFQYRAAA